MSVLKLTAPFSPYKFAFFGAAKVDFYLQPRSLFALQPTSVTRVKWTEVDDCQMWCTSDLNVIKVKNVKCVSVKCKRIYLKS